MSFIALVSFCIVSIVDSIASERGKSRIFKIFIVPLALLILFFNHAMKGFFPIALVFCWLGDLFLMKNGDNYFAAGLLSFLITHILFACHYYFVIPGWRLSIVLLAMIPYILYCFVYLKKVYIYTPHELKFGVFLYMLSILIMSILAFVYFIETFTVLSFIEWLGTLFFILSDTLLSYQMFRHLKQKGVMPTYCMAIFLMVVAVSMNALL